MGCIWSSRENEEADSRGRPSYSCLHCGRWLAGPNETICTTCRSSRPGYVATTSARLAVSGERRYGEFKCHQCRRRWNSAYAYMDGGQKCASCLILIKPHTTYALDTPGLYKSDKEHRQELCERCRILGRHCGNRVESGYVPAPLPKLRCRRGVASRRRGGPLRPYRRRY